MARTRLAERGECRCVTTCPMQSILHTECCHRSSGHRSECVVMLAIRAAGNISGSKRCVERRSTKEGELCALQVPLFPLPDDSLYVFVEYVQPMCTVL